MSNTVDALKNLYKTLTGQDYSGDPNPTDAEMIDAIAKDATGGGSGGGGGITLSMPLLVCDTDSNYVTSHTWEELIELPCLYYKRGYPIACETDYEGKREFVGFLYCTKADEDLQGNPIKAYFGAAPTAEAISDDGEGVTTKIGWGVILEINGTNLDSDGHPSFMLSFGTGWNPIFS